MPSHLPGSLVAPASPSHVTLYQSWPPHRPLIALSSRPVSLLGSRCSFSYPSLAIALAIAIALSFSLSPSSSPSPSPSCAPSLTDRSPLVLPDSPLFSCSHFAPLVGLNYLPQSSVLTALQPGLVSGTFQSRMPIIHKFSGTFTLLCSHPFRG